MPIVKIKKAFSLVHGEGNKQDFAIGEHEVSDEVAGHWYVKAHLYDAPHLLPADEQAAGDAVQIAKGKLTMAHAALEVANQNLVDAADELKRAEAEAEAAKGAADKAAAEQKAKEEEALKAAAKAAKGAGK